VVLFELLDCCGLAEPVIRCLPCAQSVPNENGKLIFYRHQVFYRQILQ
jgi:hypothetical protein